MKFIAYMLAGCVFLSILINPVIEMLGAFSDMVKINAAVYASSRAAIMDAENEAETRNVEAVIKHDVFRKRFEEYLCTALNLDDKDPDNISPNKSILVIKKDNNNYNDFTINYIDSTQKDSFTFEVISKYKFKTGVFKKISKDMTNNFDLRIRRTQRFEITN